MQIQTLLHKKHPTIEYLSSLHSTFINIIHNYSVVSQVDRILPRRTQTNYCIIAEPKGIRFQNILGYFVSVTHIAGGNLQFASPGSLPSKINPIILWIRQCRKPHGKIFGKVSLDVEEIFWHAFLKILSRTVIGKTGQRSEASYGSRDVIIKP